MARAGVLARAGFVTLFFAACAQIGGFEEFERGAGSAGKNEGGGTGGREQPQGGAGAGAGEDGTAGSSGGDSGAAGDTGGTTGGTTGGSGGTTGGSRETTGGTTGGVSPLAGAAGAGGSVEPPLEPPDGMVAVEAVSFSMGNGVGSASPVHTVALEAFYIDVTEVTAGAYAECVQADACEAAGTTDPACTANQAELSDHPANCVNWQQARAYCEWREMRLPTEAEWEYAAGGGDGRVYPWGDQNWMSTDPLYLNANGAGDGFENTAPVGSFADGESPTGLLDMAGNVWEWVEDSFCESYAEDCVPPSLQRRVFRGGGYRDDGADDFTVTRRNAADPVNTRNAAIGFRCAATP